MAVETAPENNPGSRPVLASSQFDYNYNLAGSYRFGELGVCYMQDYSPKEELPVQSGHGLRSMNLKAPLQGEIMMHKEFFDVPLPALLPFNYEKFITRPAIGEDVDASEVGLNVQGFDTRICWFFRKVIDSLLDDFDNSSEVSPANQILWIKTLISMERFFSKGCLLSASGIQLNPLFVIYFTDSKRYFDDVFDIMMSDILDNIPSGNGLVIDSVTCRREDFSNHMYLEKLRDCSSVRFINDNIGPLSSLSAFSDPENNVLVSPTWNAEMQYVNLGKPIQLQRPLAYQAVCYENFTDSKVDYIYSCELWRQNVGDFYRDNVGLDTFSINGVDYQYDFLSAHYVSKFLNLAYDSFTLENTVWLDHMIDWSRLLFGYNRSLRYGDYFTKSRTRPLAVGDVNVEVKQGYVNIVDTIEKRWYAKYFNQVNRLNRKIADYMRGMFPGVFVGRDYHNPDWLVKLDMPISSPEVEGTSSADNTTKANTTTSVLRAGGSNFAFEFNTGMYYGVVVGIIYFDIKRYYTGIIERTEFAVDRDDFFNEYLQFVGDQPVYADEIDSARSHQEYFGYQSRYTELKQRVDYAFGAYADEDELPGWLFLSNPPGVRGEDYTQSPDFIRSRPSELDRFYSALPGLSYKSYYHFLIINSNVCRKTSPMVKNPQLD